MPRTRSADIPQEIHSLMESINAIEEIDKRLQHVTEALSKIQSTTEEKENDDERYLVRNLVLSIDAVNDFLDKVQLELDALENRISAIKALKTRQT